MKMNLFYRYFVLLGFIAFSYSCFSQNAEKMLEQHLEWSKTNTPVASKLTDEDLLIEAARAICSCAHETEIMDIVREAGRRFDIEGMGEFADNKENNVVDPDYQEAKRMLRSLLEYSKSIYGEGAYATVCIYPWLINCMTMSDMRPAILEFNASAQSLDKKEANERSKELLLLAELYDLVGDKEYEDPSIIREFLALSEDIVEFYAKSKLMSHYRWMAYLGIWRYSRNFEYGDGYFTIEMSKCGLYKSGHGSFNYMAGKTESVEPDHMAFADFFITAKHILKTILHENHPEAISLELLGYQYNIGKEEFVSELRFQFRLKYICNFVKAYYGEESSMLVDTHTTIRQCTNDKVMFDADVWDYARDLMIARKFDNGSGWMLLNTLSSIFYENTSIGNPGSEYAEEILDLMQKYHAENRLKLLSLRAHICAPLQRMGIAGHEASFTEIVDEYLQQFIQEPNWECVSIGKRLLNNMGTYFKDLPRCVALAHGIIKMEKVLAGEDSDLFACEYFNYGRLAQALNPYIPLTIDGRKDMDALYDDILKVCEGSCVPRSATRLMAGIYYAQSSNSAKAVPLLKEAEREWDAENIITRLGYPNKCPIYTMLMLCYQQDNNNTDSLEYYVQKLEQEIGDDYSRDYSKFECCYFLANYLACTKREKKALQIIQQCYDAYDLYNFPKGDVIYMHLVEMLLRINGNVNGNMDACHQIVDKFNKELTQSKLLVDPIVYLNLMKMYYFLLERKEPNNLLGLEKIMADMADTYMRLPESAQSELIIFFNYKLFFYSKYANFLSRRNQFLAMAKYSGHEDNMQVSIQNISSTIREVAIPEMESRKEEMQAKMPFAYPGLLLTLANAYNSIDSIDKAEYYFKESYLLNPTWDSCQGLVLFYESHGRIAEACELCDTLANIIRKDIDDSGLTDLYANMKLDLEGLLFRIYYKAEKYDKAMSSALLYKQLISHYIEQNLDLMTETERENFIGAYGAGGYPLMAMLPHNKTLAGKTYDTMLEEKGLLLRASERIERAIRNSGNKELVTKLDSLQALRSEFSNIHMDNMLNTQENQNLLDKQQQLQYLEREVARDAKQYMTSTSVPTWQDVRKGLKANEVAVEYIITDSMLAALVLKQEFTSPIFVHLSNYSENKEMLDFLSTASQEAIVEELYVKDTFHLYDFIWKPIQEIIGNASTVYYSPIGFLNAISFAAIKVEDRTCLIDIVDLHQVTTTARLAQRKELSHYRLKKGFSAKVYGALCYDDSQLDDYNRCVESTDTETLHYNKRGALDDLPFLDNTVREINMLQQVLESAKIRVEVKKAMEATEVEFRKMDGKSPDILHISTHGFFYSHITPDIKADYIKKAAVSNSMTLSGLALSNALPAWYGEKHDSSNDNIISSAEVATMDLSNTRLVFLSACQTGLGGIAYDGVFGVQRGFKKAGIDSMCVSLWSVNDDSTATLATEFYKNIANGKTDFHQAFIDAQKRQRAITPDPYDWASFVLVDAPL